MSVKRRGDELVALRFGVHLRAQARGSEIKGGNEFFGEIALASDAPRNATVTSTSPVRALVTTARAFDSLMRRSPLLQLKALRKALRSLAERVAPDEPVLQQGSGPRCCRHWVGARSQVPDLHRQRCYARCSVRDLTPVARDQADKLADAFYRCVDVGSFVADFLRKAAEAKGLTIPADAWACVRTNAGKSVTLRHVLADALVSGGRPGLGTADPQAIASEILGGCLTAAQLAQLAQALAGG